MLGSQAWWWPVYISLVRTSTSRCRLRLLNFSTVTHGPWKISFQKSSGQILPSGSQMESPLRGTQHEGTAPCPSSTPSFLRGYYTTWTRWWNKKTELKQIPGPRRWCNHKPHDISLERAQSLQSSCMKCSARYAYTKPIQQRGKCPSCSQSTRVVTNLRLAQPDTWVAFWLNCSRESLFFDWLNSQKLTVRWQKINLEHVLAYRSTMQYIACSLLSNTTYHRRVLQYTLPSEEKSSPCYLWEVVWRMWKHPREIFSHRQGPHPLLSNLK